MKVRLGFRITLVLVILALTLSGETVDAQRAGKIINVDYFHMHQGRACIDSMRLNHPVFTSLRV